MATSADLGLDHFLFYDMATQPGGEWIGVQTQFDDRAERIALRAATMFGNPVQKNEEKILDRNAHLTFWTAYDQLPDPMRVVNYSDQFGRRKVIIGRKYGFLSPTQKAFRGSRFPEELDHYVAFQVLDASPAAVNKAVKLRDQFGRYEAKVGQPLFFAAPSRKWHNGEAHGVNNADAHLAVYRISPSPAENAVKSRDQFGSRIAHTGRTVLLAVPCKKGKWQPYD